MAYKTKAMKAAEAAALLPPPDMMEMITPQQAELMDRLERIKKSIIVPDSQRTYVGNYQGMLEVGMTSTQQCAAQFRHAMKTGTPDEKRKAEQFLVALGWAQASGTKL